jgi:CPA2 family monovalent cation:H+ antiporter-2
VGEFSFVLSRVGLSEGVISNDEYQLFLASSVVTLLLTPFMMEFALRTVDRFTDRVPSVLPEGETAGSNHVIIVGFGVNGQNVARVLRRAGIPYQIIEMNPQTIVEYQEKGEPIFFGDATRREVLLHAGVDRARAMVIAISDPPSTRRVTSLARQLNAALHIIVRTRYVHEMEGLYRDGASEVIPEEYETSVEIFTRLLREYLIPSDVINQFVAEIRAHGYEMFRKLHYARHSPSLLESELPGIQVESFRVGEGSIFHGKKLEELRLRGETGVTIVAVRRRGEMIPNPDGKFIVEEGDLLIGIGNDESMQKLTRLMA